VAVEIAGLMIEVDLLVTIGRAGALLGALGYARLLVGLLRRLRDR
jgi:hypothetical protein